MCTNCGCQGDKATMVDLRTGKTTTLGASHHDHEHTHHSHDHGHSGDGHHEHPLHHHGPHQHSADAHDHSHAAVPSTAVNIVDVERRILAKNDATAAKNRAWFTGREILAVNLISAPGAGKTTLLERTIRELADEVPLAVIEGDQATANDGERIHKAGAPVVQVNTGTGCHLDADMVARALPSLRPALGAVMFIENVGNLVCPALFDLGERAKVVVFSITEGEDKPLKYPYMFRTATAVVLNKIDLLQHLEFSLEKAIANVRQVNPEAIILEISSRTGEGMGNWYGWLRAQLELTRQSAFA